MLHLKLFLAWLSLALIEFTSDVLQELILAPSLTQRSPLHPLHPNQCCNVHKKQAKKKKKKKKKEAWSTLEEG